MEIHQRIVYRLNDNDEVCFENPENEEFSASNSGKTFVANVFPRPKLWDFISDETTRELYRDVVKSVRSGKAVRFQFRCDAPNCRRLMEMSVTRCVSGEIEFSVDTIREEMREAIPLLESTEPRSHDFLLVCSWCKKVRIGDHWVEIEEALKSSQLMERAILPQLTHGICNPCYERMSSLLNETNSKSVAILLEAQNLSAGQMRPLEVG